jgi:hypothetical protein
MQYVLTHFLQFVQCTKNVHVCKDAGNRGFGRRSHVKLIKKQKSLIFNLRNKIKVFYKRDSWEEPHF